MVDRLDLTMHAEIVASLRPEHCDASYFRNSSTHCTANHCH